LGEEELKNEIISEFAILSSDHQLRLYEIPVNIMLTDDPWTMENGLITTSFKVVRKRVIDKYWIHN